METVSRIPKVTMDMLRSMKLGETVVFPLPNVAALRSAQSLAYQAQRLLDCGFATAIDFTDNTIRITKSM